MRWPAVLGLALALRLIALGTTDLRDLPGPAGQMILAAAYADRHPMVPAGENPLLLLWGARNAGGAPIPDRHFLLERLLVHLGGDHALALQVLVLVGGLAAVAGVMAAAQALSDERGGTLAGLLAALWAPAVMGSLLVGDEQVAAGMVWGGLGLCWLGAGRWPALLSGALLVLVGAQLRESVAPLVPLLLLAPLLTPRRWPAAAVTLTTVALTVGLYSVGGFRYVTDSEQSAIGVGLSRLWSLAGADTLWLWLAGGLVFGAVPGPRRLLRLALGLSLLPMLGFSVSAGGELLRMRHVYQLAWPALVLCGVGVGAWWGMHRRSAAVALALLGLHLGLDGLDLSSAWSRARVQEHRAWASTLPGPVPGWSRYRFTRGELNSLSVPGGGELMELSAVPSLVTVYLHDERQSLAVMMALRGGGEALLVEPRECCRGRADCAPWLLERLTGTLVAPDPEGLAWTEVRDVDFVRALRASLGPPDQDGRDWDAWELRGGVSESVCPAGARWAPDGGNPAMAQRPPGVPPPE